MESTTFPNQLGRDLPRRIVSVTADEMVYANPNAPLAADRFNYRGSERISRSRPGFTAYCAMRF